MKYVAILAALAGSQVMAQEHCAPHDVVVERLGENYGETRQSLGLDAVGSVVEVFASLETGTWTITVTRPGGPTCIAAVGEHYQVTSEQLPPLGEDS